jgi:hypothetical protein
MAQRLQNDGCRINWRNVLPKDDPPNVTRFRAGRQGLQASTGTARMGLRCLTVRVGDEFETSEPWPPRDNIRA